MKNYFVIAFFMSMGSICHAQKQVVLDLTDGITWEGVFEGGFRPHYMRDGTFSCSQLDVDVLVKTQNFPEGLNIGRGDAQFRLLENNLVIGFSFYGRENRSLEEAKIKSETFAKMFGENVTQGATLKTFQNKHEVDYAGNKIVPPEIAEHVDLKTSTNAAKIDDFSIIYSFGDSYSDDLPLVERLSVALKSNEAKRAKRLSEKIKPPIGYEHISLEPPPFVASGNEKKPKSESNSEKNVSKSIGEKKITREVVEDENPRSLSWLYCVLGALILGGFGVLVWNSRKGSSAR